MSRAEYSQHSRKIKNDIEIIKDTINNFKELNEYFKKKKNNYKYNTRYDNSNANLNKSLDKKRNNGNISINIVTEYANDGDLHIKLKEKEYSDDECTTNKKKKISDSETKKHMKLKMIALEKCYQQ